MARGGMIVEVVAGVRKGLYGQAPYHMQKEAFGALKKVYIQYFKNPSCTERVCDDKGKHIAGLTDTANVRHRGFYR